MFPSPAQDTIFRSEVPGKNLAEKIFARCEVIRSVRTFPVYGSVMINRWSSDPDNMYSPVSFHLNRIKIEVYKKIILVQSNFYDLNSRRLKVD